MTPNESTPLHKFGLIELAEIVAGYSADDPEGEGPTIRATYEALPDGSWQWLLWARMPAADALLEEVVRGYLHPTWCTRSVRPQNIGLETRAAQVDGDAGRRIRLTSPPAQARAMAEAVHTMLASLSQRPMVSGMPRVQLSTALRLLDVEVEAGRGDRAREIGGALIANGSFSATDINFIECRCLAAERRHQEVLEVAMNSQFGSLTAIPRGVSRDVARAIVEKVLDPIAGADTERREALLGVSGFVTGCVLSPRVGSTLQEREIWRLLEIQPVPAGGEQANPEDAEHLPPAEAETVIAGEDTGVTRSWIEFLADYATTPSVDHERLQLLEAQLDEGSETWPLWEQGCADAGRLADLIVSLVGLDVLPKIRGHLIEHASEEPLILAAVARALWSTQAYRAATREDATGALAAALEIGLPDVSFHPAAESGIAQWTGDQSMHAFPWALDLAILLQDHGEQTRAHSTRLASMLGSFARSEFESGAPRISDVQLAELNTVLARAGHEKLAMNASAPEDSDFAHLNGKRILIYSLHEHPARMAQERLEERCVGTSIEVRSDHDCSEQLVSASRGADLIIVVTRAAKHAATECIQRHGAKISTRFAAGTGWSSILTQASLPIDGA